MLESGRFLPSAPAVLWTLAAALVGALLSFALVIVVLIRLPADAFSATRSPSPPRLIFRIARNLLGGLLIVVGLILAIPGVPGQGILTVVMGLLLIDLPGKSRLLRALMAKPGLRIAANRLRTRYGRAPFTW